MSTENLLYAMCEQEASGSHQFFSGGHQFFPFQVDRI